MEGEEEDSDDERAFNRKPVWKRILVVAMGAVMEYPAGPRAHGDPRGADAAARLEHRRPV